MKKGTILQFYANAIRQWFGTLKPHFTISYTFKSSGSQMFLKIVVLKNFENFTGKHLCWSLFLRKCNFINKRFKHRCFRVKFLKFWRRPFLTEHLWWLLLYSLSTSFGVALLGKSSLHISLKYILQNKHKNDRRFCKTKLEKWCRPLKNIKLICILERFSKLLMFVRKRSQVPANLDFVIILH